MVYTHDVGGLTQLDFELALYIDEALKQMDARQLDEEKKGLYYYVNKKKKSGRKPNPKGHPDRPSAQDWKDAAKTAKKENVEEKWSEKYKKSINCNNPKGFSQKAHCAGRKK